MNLVTEKLLRSDCRVRHDLFLFKLIGKYVTPIKLCRIDYCFCKTKPYPEDNKKVAFSIRKST